MKIKTTNEELEQYKTEMRALLEKSGRIVHASVESVSSSGMSRQINLYAIVPLTKKEQEAAERRGTAPKVAIHWISRRAAAIIGESFNDKNRTMVVSGCGMDMLFATVYSLGRVLYPNGDGKTIVGRNGDKKPETDGGYLLRYEEI